MKEIKQFLINLGFKSRLLVFGGHVGGHIGFLGSPSFMPIYAGSFRNYRECGTFWYMTHLVVRGGPGSQFFSLESHPTNIKMLKFSNGYNSRKEKKTKKTKKKQ